MVKFENQRILVIYYIELRTRYFNEFVKKIHVILTQLRNIEPELSYNIEAISQSPQWSYRKLSYRKLSYQEYFLPNILLELLIKQANRRITKSSVIKDTEYYLIAESEKRDGLFPDDGLFTIFKVLTNYDIQTKIKAENERIKSFLQNIQTIITGIENSDAYKQWMKADYPQIQNDLYKSPTKGAGKCLRIAPEPISVSHITDTKSTLKIYKISQDNIEEFLTKTYSVIKSIDTIALYLYSRSPNKNSIVFIVIRQHITKLLEKYNAYRENMLELISKYKFKSNIDLVPSYTSVLSKYYTYRNNQVEQLGGRFPDKKKKLPIRAKPKQRIRLRFP
jgi:hypothetical protein